MRKSASKALTVSSGNCESKDEPSVELFDFKRLAASCLQPKPHSQSWTQEDVLHTDVVNQSVRKSPLVFASDQVSVEQRLVVEEHSLNLRPPQQVETAKLLVCEPEQPRVEIEG